MGWACSSSGPWACCFWSSGPIGLWCTRKVVLWHGVSPRGRGNLRHPFRIIRQHRSIPAWAGEPATVQVTLQHIQVYPRVGGGTGDSPSHPPAYPGLSPRGRGNLKDRGCTGCHLRSIPAWAGEPYLPTTKPKRSIPAWAGEPYETRSNGRYSGVYPCVGGGTS